MRVRPAPADVEVRRVMVNPDERRAIGIDVGGTKILGVVADARGRLLERVVAPTPNEPDDVTVAIRDVLLALVDRSRRSEPESGAELVGVGIGVPGLVDRSGVLRYGPNVPGVVGLDTAAAFGPVVDLPIVADNDASLAALAEHRVGAARGHDHVVLVTLGTGIGGGLIVDGALLRGANGFAGEPGHLIVDPAGPMCACGNRGCWEAVASGTGLANLARLLVADGGGAAILELAGGDPGRIRGEHVTEAVSHGDPDAAALFQQFARWVAVGVGGLVTVFDPTIVVLGGGLSVASARFLPEVQAHLADVVLGAAYRPPVPVVPTELGADAGAVGGAIMALESDADHGGSP